MNSWLVNLCTFLGFTFFSVFLCISVYIFIRTPSYPILYFTTSALLWVFYYIPCMIWMTIYASLSETEGVRTADLLQRLVSTENRSGSLKRLRIVMQQFTHRTPRISCTLFDLNWKFFLNMLGAIFSITIILIQFYETLNLLATFIWTIALKYLSSQLETKNKSLRHS